MPKSSDNISGMAVPESDLPNMNVVPEEDLPKSKPVPETDMPKMKAEAPPDVSGLEATGRGAAQAFALGYSPQIIAAIKSGKLPGSSDPEYVKELTKQKAATEQAWEQHPYLYGTGMVASAVPAVIGSIVGAPAEVAAAGGLGAARLLANSSSLGNLAAAGLRGLAGAGEGIAPSVTKKAASVLASPITQGAIYGSSEGETIPEKLSGAAAGAVGAKVAPIVLRGAGKAIGAVGEKIAPKITDPIMAVLTGSPTKADIAGDLAARLDIPLPAQVVGEANVPSMISKADILNQVPKAAGRTLGKLGENISSYAGDVTPVEAGSAIRSAVNKWVSDPELPNGFNKAIDALYEPVSELKTAPVKFNAASLRAAIDDAMKSPVGTVSDIMPTVNVVLGAATRPDNLSFAELQALKKVVSDQLTFNKLPGSQGLDESILQSFRSAINKDMQNAAKTFGGTKMLAAFNNANAEAEKLYNVRSNLLKIVGNPTDNVNAPGYKPEGAIYQNIINGLAYKGKGAGLQAVKNLKDVVTDVNPEAWDSVHKTYINSIAPEGSFSFKNFDKLYNKNLHPMGKTILFGEGPNTIGGYLDNLNKFGKIDANGIPLGSKLDSLGAQAGYFSPQALPLEGAAALAETMLLGGLPVKTMTLAGLGTAAGKYGARDIAKQLPEYAPSAPVRLAREALEKASPALAAQTMGPTLGPAIEGGAIYGGANLINQLPPEALGGAGFIGQKLFGNADGGRIKRQTGGRIKSTQSEAEALMKAAEDAKKGINKTTETILSQPDEHVAKALEIAKQHI